VPQRRHHARILDTESTEHVKTRDARLVRDDDRFTHIDFISNLLLQRLEKGPPSPEHASKKARALHVKEVLLPRDARIIRMLPCASAAHLGERCILSERRKARCADEVSSLGTITTAAAASPKSPALSASSQSMPAEPMSLETISAQRARPSATAFATVSRAARNERHVAWTLNAGTPLRPKPSAR
jgi:hypothetical protein